MSQDGSVPLSEVLLPRQTSSAGSYSTESSSIATLSTSIPTTTYTPRTGSHFPHAFISTVTSGQIELEGKICTAALPAGGIIEFNDTYILYIDQSASFVAPCANHSIFNNSHCAGLNATILSPDEPFYISISPQVYALATATVISYILVILIFITPRTFYIGGPGGGPVAGGTGTGLRTLFPGSSGRNAGVIGIGRRPLLQKIAALTVAISLTIATADTFRVAEEQYASGFIESKELVSSVVGSLEIRITRVISDTFLWLAQVQTLIRLFPRHKEKVTIKWLGFGLVLCDTVFSILENFISSSMTNRSTPGNFKDAIPALSYLFELSIGLIYASCVLYYALSKRRFAFWHAKMRNVCLVAMLSIIAVLIPVVFFVTDRAQPDIATWGEYIRWVGAAAASVVVWEWVERIEALERDEKKDGILGREIFDGDEMIDLTPSEDGFDYARSSRSVDGEMRKRSKFWRNVKELNIDIQPKIPLRRFKRAQKQEKNEQQAKDVNSGRNKSENGQITRPPQAITPISRSDTNSATSTLYAVRYHDTFSPSPAIPEDRVVNQRRQSVPVNELPAVSDESTLTNSTGKTLEESGPTETGPMQATSTGRQIWQGVANPFKRKRAEPPAEVAAQIADSNARRSPIDANLNLKTRFNAFTAAQKSRLIGRAQKSKTPLGVTVIPAQPRASRANVGTEDGDEHGPAEMLEPDATPGNEAMQDSNLNSPDLDSLPVTVIPAPVRGGRTWSPDDMVHTQAASPPPPPTSSQGQRGTPPFHFGDRPSSLTPTHQDSPQTIQSQRGALTISESPGRLRDRSTPTHGPPSLLNRSRNNRSATLTSISDRLGSASPADMHGSAGLRSAPIDPSRPPPTSTGEGSGRNPS